MVTEQTKIHYINFDGACIKISSILAIIQHNKGTKFILCEGGGFYELNTDYKYKYIMEKINGLNKND